MPSKAAPRARKTTAARHSVTRRKTTTKKTAKQPTKLAWHSHLRNLRGFATRKPLMFVVGFAAIGMMIMSVSHAETAPPTGAVVNMNGMCMTVKGGSTTNGTPVQLNTCNRSVSQTWSLPGDGTIRNQSKCLDTASSSTKNGAKLALNTCNTRTATQKWTWTTTTSTTTIKNNANRLCVDNTGVRKTEGNPLQVYSCWNTDAQKWTMPQVNVQPTPPAPAPAPTPTPTTPEPTPTPTPTPGTGSTSGEAMPVGDLQGWKQIFADDFTVDAPTGSWATTDASKVVYTGDKGGKWTVYPDGWSSTYTSGKPGYQPGQVLSVHDGYLDFYLHSVNGYPSGANPSPLIGGTTPNQTYGRYAARIKSDTISNYHAAWLLWPIKDADGGCAESDFPEGDLNSTVSAFAHNSTNCSDYRTQNAFPTNTRFDSGWHTYVQEWGPGFRKYYIDGNLIGTSTTRVWSQPARWQLQVEPNSNSGTTSGHFQVDWVAAYSYNP